MTRFLRDDQGTMVVIFAIMLSVLMIAGGLAVDFGRGMHAKTEMQNAVDAAALASAKAAMSGDAASSEAIARAYFNENAGTDLGSKASLKIDSAEDSVTVTAKISMPTTFMKIAGFNEMAITASSTATKEVPSYFQIHFLVDVSSSMSVGGTEADVQNLKAKFGCAFTCHDVNNTSGPDNRTAAKKLGIKAKMDYVNSAITSFMEKLKPLMEKNPDRFEAAIYTFGTSFTVASSLSGDPDDALNAAALIDVEITPPRGAHQHQGDTKTSAAMATLSAMLANVGDGSAPNRRNTYVVYITDGLEDLALGPNRTLATNYTSECKSLKNEGVKIMAIASPTPTTADQTYVDYRDRVERAMKECASTPADYHLAQDGPEIQDALDKVFKAFSGAIRIKK